jgi:DNA-directed RNA polymerase specialized sigma24 family protein
LAQETFVAAWKTLGDLREPIRLRPWLCGIARHRICDVFRGEKREPSHAAETLDQVDEA